MLNFDGFLHHFHAKSLFALQETSPKASLSPQKRPAENGLTLSVRKCGSSMGIHEDFHAGPRATLLLITLSLPPKTPNSTAERQPAGLSRKARIVILEENVLMPFFFSLLGPCVQEHGNLSTC